MNHFIAGILKIALLEGSAALLLLDRVAGVGPGTRYERERKAAWLVMAALALAAFTDYGAFRIHVWEQFHFYLGAKYQQEVGWFDLYKAALLADRESVHVLDGVTETRDCATFERVPVEQTLATEGPRVRARFSDSRWEEFKRDWVALSGMDSRWRLIVADHGNSNSPAWSIFAHPIASVVPLTRSGLALIALLDWVLLVALGLALYRAFGVRAASVGVIIASMAPIVFDYLGGSFLRWDWLFAVGLAMCCLERKRYGWAGGLFGYAVATKLFPVFFGVALAVRALIRRRRERRLDRSYLRFGASAIAVGLAAVLISSAMLGGPGVWSEYKRRIDAARVEKFYPIQYSLRTVYLQVASAPAEFFRTGFFPREIAQAKVNLADHRWGLLAVQLLLTALIAAAIARSGDDAAAFAIGPFFVFTWLVVNMYYWNMLGLTAIGLTRRGRPGLLALLGLHGCFALFYLYQHLNRGFAEGYAVALGLLVTLLVWGGLEMGATDQSSPR
jgi:hypothetical protein